MKMNKILSAVVGTGLFVSGSVMASPITVGVATWNPDFDNYPFSTDFNAGGSLSQFFTTNDNSIAKEVSVDDISGVIAGATADVGDFLTGVGGFGSFNSNPNFLCTGCELTYAFGGIEVVGFSSLGVAVFDTSNSWMTVYSDSSADFLPADASSFLNAQNGDVFLEATFDAMHISLGNLTSGSSESLVSVTGGAAFGNFDTDFFGSSDLKLTGTGNFLSNPLFSNAGQITVVGNSIPEPTSLALLGLGLLGFGAAKRRKS